MLGDLKTPEYIEEPVIPFIGRAIAPILSGIDDEVGTADLSSSGWRDPFVPRAIGILGVSTDLALFGLVQALVLTQQTIPYTLDFSSSLPHVVFIGLAFLFLLLIGAVVLLRRGARTQLVLLEVLLIGSFGCVTSTGVLMHRYNMEYDHAPADVYAVQVIEKKSSKRTRRMRERYHIRSKGWFGDSSRQRRTRVSQSLFHSLDIGDQLEVTQRSGALGYRWVESLQRPPQ